MPNWCDNAIYVTGPQAELDRFHAAAKATGTTVEGTPRTSPLSFGSILPMPPEVDPDNPAAKDKDAWFMWRVTNWGAKWDLAEDDVHETHGEGESCYRFSTAWSPCVGFVNACAERFPELAFLHVWEESGNGFTGFNAYVEGRLTASADSDLWQNPAFQGDEDPDEDGEYEYVGYLCEPGALDRHLRNTHGMESILAMRRRLRAAKAEPAPSGC